MPFSEQPVKQPIYGTLCRKRKPQLKHLVSWDGLISILNDDTVWATWKTDGVADGCFTV